MSTLETIYREHYPDSAIRRHVHELCNQWPLLHFASPLLCWSASQIQEAILNRSADESPPSMPHMDSVVEIFIDQIADRCIAITARVLALEVNVRRLEGSLVGKSSRQRFRTFAHELRDPELSVGLLKLYPPLADLLEQVCKLHTYAAIELLGRLSEDLPSLCRKFGTDGRLGHLASLEVGRGDTHSGGRSVAILHFSCGKSVVYKPRSLAVDSHFVQLVDFLNAYDIGLPLRAASVLDRGMYGWQEYIAHNYCSTPRELKDFYERFGKLLALVYVLCGTDIHHENLIADRDTPVPIDMETLFQPRWAARDSVANIPLIRILSESVFTTCMLPSVLSEKEIDHSALGGTPGQPRRYTEPTLVNTGTDRLRLVRRRSFLSEAKNLPIDSNDVGRSVSHHLDDLVRGFSRMYMLLFSLRDAIIKQRELEIFADDTIRIIMRPTQSYAVFLDESTHPDIVTAKSEYSHAHFWNRLNDGLPTQPWLVHAIEAERDDLRRGDIPIFKAGINSLQMFDSRQGPIGVQISVSGLDNVIHRLSSLSQADLRRQVWLIEASFPPRTDSSGSKMVRRSFGLTSSITLREQKSAIRHIVGQLQTAAFPTSAGVTWLTLKDRASSGKRQLGEAGLDLYDGIPGIALFLMSAHATIGDGHASDLGRMAIDEMISQIETTPTSGVGGFTGVGGLMYALMRLSVHPGGEGLATLAERLTRNIIELTSADRVYDIIGGSAGCISPLLEIHQKRASMAALEALLLCGDHILAGAKRMSPGIGWARTEFAQPLTGFGHGAAGIALAMARLEAASQGRGYGRIAIGALQYERSTFDSSAGVWPDFRLARRERRAASGSSGWCHGAAGIGLSRTAFRKAAHITDDTMIDEICAAVSALVRKRSMKDDSLCHGSASAIEFLAAAHDFLDRKQQQFVATLTQNFASRLRIPQPGYPDAGLMTGISGRGYTLLRILSPETNPSVLLQEY